MGKETTNLQHDQHEPFRLAKRRSFMQLEDVFRAIEEMRDKASVGAVFGEPVKVGEKTIIPVADIKYGFGFGYGEGPAESFEREEPSPSGQGGGVGGGIAARPVAVLEITDQEVKVKPVLDEGRIALTGIFAGIWFIYWIASAIKAIFGK
jgi:uncharacterized spore protein YtfJ